MRDLSLLIIVGGKVLRDTFSLLTEVDVVVAVVALQLPVGDFDDATADAVEEFTVVRDCQDGARVAFQFALKPAECLEVQVIGRLIQHQQVGLHH